MTLATTGIIKRTFVGDNVEFIKFEGDDVNYLVENNISQEFIKGMEVKPASFWRNFGFGSSQKKQDKKSGYAVINKDIIRNFLKPRYIQHFLLGDTEADPASVDMLNRQAKKLGVANIPYNFPKYDCEDRSFACMGAWHLNIDTAAMATYIVWVTYQEGGEEKAHALNGYCTGENFFLYEPAQYKSFLVPEFWMINVLIG